jgi:hypothetical protein
MTPSEAASWLDQVDGQRMRNPNADDPSTTWIVLVRAPDEGPREGKLIVCFGPTLVEATAAAEAEWQQIWRSFGPSH